MRHPTRVPNLAQRHAELKRLNWPGSNLVLVRGRELRFGFTVMPAEFSRDYRCQLRLYPARVPDMLVLEPNLKTLAPGRELPHVYPHDGIGTRLCLWFPKSYEWSPTMRLDETYLAWTAEWLDYFEHWLATDEWTGGGVHPDTTPKRWARAPALPRSGIHRL